MLTENTIRELTHDALFELMRFKIEEIRFRRDNADHQALLEVVDEIMLIQKVIDEKSLNTPAVQVKDAD